jgi:hypothetical protein
MTRDLDTDGRDEPRTSFGDRRRNRRFYKELGFAFVLEVALFAGAIAVIFTKGTVIRKSFGAALLLTVPLLVALIGIAVVVIRHIGRLDDYQRMMTYRSLAIAFGLTLMSCVLLFLLRMVASLGEKGTPQPDGSTRFTLDLSVLAPAVLGIVISAVLLERDKRR